MKYHIIILFCFCISIETNAQFSQPATLYQSSESSPFSSSTVDMDQDGDLDILQQSSREITWIENINGSLAPPKILVSGDFGNLDIACLAVDVDGDGDLDITCLQEYTMFLAKNENGSFGELVTFKQLPHDTYGFQFIDIDSDNKIDLLSYDQQSRELGWISDIGNASMAATISVIDSSINLTDRERIVSYKLALNDINNDGLTDIVTVEYVPSTVNDPAEYNIIWYENIDGSGRFIPKRELLKQGNYINNFWFADLNGDSINDLVYGNRNPEQLKVLLYEENNNNVFNPFPATTILEESTYDDVVFEDFDRDQDIDIIARHPSLVYFLNEDGLGSYGEKNIVREKSNFAFGESLSVFDFNGDGDKDILDKNHLFENTVGEPGAFFPQGSKQLLNVDDGILNISDLDNDGKNDIIYLGFSDSLFWRKNIGNKVFSEPIKIPFVLPRDIPHGDSLYTIDFDGDGDLDIFLPDYGNISQVDAYWLENMDGKGDFSLVKIIDLGLNKIISSIKYDDVDGDGLNDLILLRKIHGDEIYISKNLGNGIFQDADPLYNAYSDIDHIETIDFDGDGDLDILVELNSSNTLRNLNQIHLIENIDGAGNFIFDPSPLIREEYLGRTVWRWVMTDIDSDGDKDILAIFEETDSRSISSLYAYYRTQDSLNFQKKIVYNLNNDSQYYLRPVDLDGDGDMDLMTSINRSDGAEIRWFENKNGKGVYEEHKLPYSPSGFGFQIVYEDIDLDGDIDVFELNGSIIENHQEKASFNVVERLDNGFEPTLIAAADINDDGVNDILCNNLHDENYSYGDNSFVEQTKVLAWYEIADLENGEIRKKHELGVGTGVPHPVDIDGDGDLDLVSIAFPRGEAIQLSKKNEIGYDVPFNIHFDNDRQIRQLIPYDLDSDGDMDIVYSASQVSSSFLGRVYILENIDGSNFTNHYVGFINMPANIYLAENSDSTTILLASARDNLYQFKQEDVFGNATERLLIADYWAFNTLNVVKIDLDDDNNDDFLDYINKIWFRNNGNREFELISFSGSTIDITPKSIFRATDVDHDQDQDIVYHDNGTIGWIENIGGPTYFNQFRVTTIAQVEGLNDLKITDLDSDFDTDIIFSTKSQINWIENLTVDPLNYQIAGVCFYDGNRNKIYDEDEVILSNQKVWLEPDETGTLTNSSGQFKFFVPNGNYNLNYQESDLWQLLSDTTVIPVEIRNSNSIDNNFPLFPKLDTSLLETFITSAPTRCGFEVLTWIDIVNNGTRVENAEFRIQFDKNVQIIEPYPSFIELVDSNEFRLSVTDFLPSDEVGLRFLLKMPGVDFIGSPVEYKVYTEYINSSISSIDSTLFRSTINCAYDPNDKLVEPDRFDDANYTRFGEPLTYTIRFQNTGTDTAFNVIILDQLDENLDWASIEVKSSSHPLSTTISETGLVSFNFENILLPDSIVNETLSHGFVKYSINPIHTVIENTEVDNKAEIYFDFNPPIVTNTIKNTYVSNIPIILSSIIGSTSCSDSEDGTITLNVIEEIPPYKYEWSHGGQEGSKLVDGIPAGLYQLTITDGLNNIRIEEFEVKSPESLEYTTQISASNGANNGRIEVMPIGGTSPYQYSWQGYPGQTTNVLNNLTSGSYALTITDANGCMLEVEIEVGLNTSTYHLAPSEYLSIYPNPSSGLFRLELELKRISAVTLNLFSVLGQHIEEFDSHDSQSITESLDLRHLRPGVYFMKIGINDKIVSKRITIL